MTPNSLSSVQTHRGTVMSMLLAISITNMKISVFRKLQCWSSTSMKNCIYDFIKNNGNGEFDFVPWFSFAFPNGSPTAHYLATQALFAFIRDHRWTSHSLHTTVEKNWISSERGGPSPPKLIDWLNQNSEKQHVTCVNRPAIVREIQHFGLFPAFPHFCENVLLYFEITKIAENRNNCSCTETFCLKKLYNNVKPLKLFLIKKYVKNGWKSQNIFTVGDILFENVNDSVLLM